MHPYLTGRSQSPLLMAIGKTLDQRVQTQTAEKLAQAEAQRQAQLENLRASYQAANFDRERELKAIDKQAEYARELERDRLLNDYRTQGAEKLANAKAKSRLQLEKLKAKYQAANFNRERELNAIDKQAEYARELERDRLLNQHRMDLESYKAKVKPPQGLVAPKMPTKVRIGDQQVMGTFDEHGTFIPSMDNQGRTLAGPVWSPDDANRTRDQLYQNSMRQAADILKDPFAAQEIAAQLKLDPATPLSTLQLALAKSLTEQHLENLKAIGDSSAGGSSAGGKPRGRKITRQDIEQARYILRTSPDMKSVIVKRLRDAGATETQIREVIKVVR